MEARVFSCNIQALYDKLFCSLTVHCVKNNLVGGGRLHIPVFLMIAFIHEGLKETVNNQCLQAFCATLGFGFFVCLSSGLISSFPLTHHIFFHTWQVELSQNLLD